MKLANEVSNIPLVPMICPPKYRVLFLILLIYSLRFHLLSHYSLLLCNIKVSSVVALFLTLGRFFEIWKCVSSFKEWKERKKFQKRLIAAKKKLSELEQQHVFHGFRYGEKTQGRLLADQIVNVNSKLFQQALQNIQITSER